MAKKQKYESKEEIIPGGENLGLRAFLTGHVCWPGEKGTIEVQYADGSIMLRSDRKFPTKARGLEYEVALFDQVNKPKK